MKKEPAPPPSQTGPGPIRVLVIDDEALVRAGLRMILESADDIVVVGEAVDGADAVDAVRRWQPDVVLMDIRMPRRDGLAATTDIRALNHPPRVLILTTFDIDDNVFRGLQAGADGFVVKDTPPRELIQAVRIIAAGDAILSPSVTRSLIAHVTSNTPNARAQPTDAALASLSPREREVLIELAAGHSNADIGATLHMSEATVKAHVTHLLTKLDRTNRVQLAILAHATGLID